MFLRHVKAADMFIGHRQGVQIMKLLSDLLIKT
jgi:hypothetical protein